MCAARRELDVQWNGTATALAAVDLLVQFEVELAPEDDAHGDAVRIFARKVLLLVVTLELLSSSER